MSDCQYLHAIEIRRPTGPEQNHTFSVDIPRIGVMSWNRGVGRSGRLWGRHSDTILGRRIFCFKASHLFAQCLLVLVHVK